MLHEYVFLLTPYTFMEEDTATTFPKILYNILFDEKLKDENSEPKPFIFLFFWKYDHIIFYSRRPSLANCISLRPWNKNSSFFNCGGVKIRQQDPGRPYKHGVSFAQG